MKQKHWAVACLAVAAAIPLSAAAEEGFTLRSVDVFAGPSSEYPIVGRLPRNAGVDVFGCLSDWSWCDVGFAGDRGWVYALDVAVPYQGRRVVILDYGPRIRLPVIVFSLNSYWDRHYHGRPWYSQRQQWISRVHIDSHHGGRAPAGHERAVSTAPQQATPSRPQQAQSQAPAQAGRQVERNAQAERNTQRAERSRPAENARVPNEAPSRVAQSPQPQQAQTREQRRAEAMQQQQRDAQVHEQRRTDSMQQQAQTREQRSAQERQRPQAPPSAEHETRAQQAAQPQESPRAEPDPRAEESPQASRAPEDRRDNRRSQQEEKKREQSGQQ
jgi:uncharacterized protein YraI